MAAATAPPGTATRRPRPLTPATLGLPDEPRKADRTASLTEHVRATVDAQLRVLLVEQLTAGRADSPESVHQIRVGARRARVALGVDQGVLGPEAQRLRAELSWLGGLAGGVRDLDVLCEHLTSESADLPEPDLAAFGEVLTALLTSRAEAASVLERALPRQRYRGLLHAMAAVALGGPDGGAPPDPMSLLAKPVKALHRQLAVSGRAPSDDGWHALRIKVKKLRYATEMAGRVAGSKKRADITALTGKAKALQELLGEFQDTVVSEQHVRDLVATHPDLSPAAVLVAGRLVERQVAKRNALRELLPGAAGDLYSATMA
ncbi:MAG TPA: CHAD domain-containing protein [Pseudonocardiaceae bacterium]|jgi:CHAD domain-containing protein|nr:CHAD domain-containing protein [Pseudonocardiaceae bacterium]